MTTELLLFITTDFYDGKINKKLFSGEYNNIIDKVLRYNENDLDDYIKEIVLDIIEKYGKRGYGYWIWKPYLIYKELEKLNDGDMLIHLDSYRRIDKIVDIFDDIKNELTDEKPIDFITVGFDDYKYTTTKLRNRLEKYLNYKFNENQLFKTQFEAGILFIKKNDFTVNFFKKYFDFMIKNIDVITDIYNNDKDNHESFIENRHDQSVFSLLCKYYGWDSSILLKYDLFI